MLSIRKISAAGFTYRHFARYRQIIRVLFRYGLEDFFGGFKFNRYVEACLQRLSRSRREFLKKYSRVERLRMALEALGPTFIKLGQALSMRPDFLPVEFVDELARLQDNVPSFSFAEVKGIIESEFNLKMEDLFESFDETPLASASIGQVHKARLKDGREAAVKVQRPDLDRLVAVDIGIMYHLASLIENHVEEIAFIRPVKIVEEFARTIAGELDYTVEADHMERFAQNFAGDPTLHIPEVYREFTTKRVLSMEFIYGIKVSDLASLEKAGIDKRLITLRGADILLRQTFVHGFFHSDPHSGNIFILPNNVIAMLDFGQVGAVDQQSREDFVDLIDSVVQQNAYKATRQLLKITFWDKKPDTRQLEKEVAEFIGKHLYKTLKDLNIGDLLHDLLYMVTRHRLRIPPDIFLMMKALATIEGIARQLEPDFDMIEQAAPFIRQIKLERLRPLRITEDLYSLSIELIGLIRRFPEDVTEIFRLIREQKLGLKLDDKSLEQLCVNRDKAANRISWAVIQAALLAASAVFITAETPPFVFGVSLLGLAGMILAGVMGVWLLLAMVRKGRL